MLSKRCIPPVGILATLSVAPVGVGSDGSAGGNSFRASMVGGVALNGVLSGCPVISGVEVEIFLVLKALRLDDDAFFLRLSGAEATLLTTRDGDGMVAAVDLSLS